MSNHTGTSSGHLTKRLQAKSALQKADLEGRLHRPAHYNTPPEPPQPVVIYVHPAPPAERDRSTYITQKSQGTPPQQLPTVPLPNLLTIFAGLIMLTLFLAGASLFSIGLTSYSNSVDRIDQTRSFINVQ